MIRMVIIPLMSVIGGDNLIVITFLNWIANLLHGTNFDLSSIQVAWDILTETIGFIGYFIPLGPVVVIVSFIAATYAWRLLVSVLKLLWSIIPLL